MGLKLTNREYQILLRMGKEYADIAHELGLQINTVVTYTNRIKAKLNTHNKTSTVLKAIQIGLVDPYQFII